MTTEPALLAQLQDAWNQSMATGPAQAIAHPMKCPQHIDPQDWIDRPAPARPGWIRTNCSRCGAFIGYGPIG